MHQQKSEGNEKVYLIRPDGSVMAKEECAGVRAVKENRLIENIEMGIVSQENPPVWIRMTSCPLELDDYGAVSTYVDVTGQKQMEHNYESLFNSMLNGFALHEIIVNEQGEPIDYRYIAVNPAFQEMTGLKGTDIIGKTILEIMPSIEKYWIEEFGKVALTGIPLIYENYVSSLDKYFEVTAYQPSAHRFSCFFTDITERIESERVIKKRLEYEHLVTTISQKATKVEDISIFMEETLASVGKILNVSRVYIYENDSKDCVDNTYEWCAQGIEVTQEVMQDVPSGDAMRWWNDKMLNNEVIPYSNILDIPDEATIKILSWQNIKSILVVPLFVKGSYFGFMGFDDCLTYRKWPEVDIDILFSISLTISTVIERDLLAKELEFQHNHDVLTRIYNRRFLEQELSRMEDEKYLPLSIIIADTNGLKLVNDSFGHKMGDQILIEAASILKKNCGPHDIVARYGGDEFVMLLPNTDNEEVRKRLNQIDNMVKSVEIASIQLTLAFGHYTRMSMDEEFNMVFKSAEDLMYRNKLTESASNKYKTIGLTMNSLFAKRKRELEHSKRVSKLCEFIAIKMNFSPREINRMRVAGLMHDIGKIGISENILNKPASLTSVEWEAMKRHPEIGYRILSTSSDFADISKAILEHHEWWNGEGYPRGIIGEDISMQARIIAIADSYDAMTTDRVYKKALQEGEAIEEIKRCSGTQFDPSIAQVFIKHLSEFAYSE